MKGVFRNTIVWSAAASFVAGSLVGDGLHFVPGFEHAFTPRLECGSSGYGCRQPAVPKTCCNGCDSKATVEPGNAPAMSALPLEHTCPVCRLLAQAKAPVDAAALPPLGEPVPAEPALVPALSTRLLTRVFDARGPPRTA